MKTTVKGSLQPDGSYHRRQSGVSGSISLHAAGLSLVRAECVHTTVVRALADIVATKLGIRVLSCLECYKFVNLVQICGSCGFPMCDEDCARC